MNDGDEVNTYNTDPNDTDTDGDGLSDYDEVMTYNTDPNDANGDADGEGLVMSMRLMFTTQIQPMPIPMATDLMMLKKLIWVPILTMDQIPYT